MGVEWLKCMKKRAYEASEGTGERREDSDGPQIEPSIKRPKASLALKTPLRHRKSPVNSDLEGVSS
jgi:hypothetical protein